MARYAELFSDWKLGSWGNRGPYWAGRREDGFFESMNLIVTDDHMLAPRQGMIEAHPTGVPAGEVTSMFFAPLENLPMLVTIGNEVWRIHMLDGVASVKIGEMGAAFPGKRTGVWATGDGFFFLAGPDGIYRINATDSTMTKVSPTINGFRSLVRHRDRLYASGNRRIFYSDAADFSSWPALSYFDVGWQFDTHRLISARDSLWVLRQGDGQHAVGGAPDSTLTVRSGGVVTPPSEHSALHVTDRDGSMWWIPQFEAGPIRMLPSGVGDERLDYLTTWAEGIDPVGAAWSYGPDALIFHDDHGNALWRMNGIWTRQSFDVPTGFMCSRVADAMYVATDGGSPGVASRWFRSRLDRVATTDTDRGGDGAFANNYPDTWLHLPVKEHAMGYEQRVVAVEVEFMSFDRGHSQTAHFDLRVRAWHPSDDTMSATPSRNYNTSKVFSFDEDMVLSSETGDLRRRRFKVGDQGWGRGYQLTFENIRGVAIRSISAVVDAEPRDTR